MKFAAISLHCNFFIESCLKRPRTMKDFFQSDFERFISKIFSSSVVRIEMVLKTCTSFTVISIFLRLIVLQTMSPTEYIDSPTVRVDIPTSLFSFFFPYKPLVLVNSRTVDMVFKSSVLLVLLPVGLSIRWSRAVCR